MLGQLPDRQAAVGRRIPVGRQLIAPEQADLPPLRLDQPVAGQGVDRRVLGLAERLRVAVGAFVHPVLLEPRERPAGVGVELTLLLGEALVEDLVDETERRPHRHPRSVGLDDRRIAREDGHARPDHRLRKVHGRDVSVLQVLQRQRQIPLERGH